MLLSYCTPADAHCIISYMQNYVLYNPKICFIAIFSNTGHLEVTPAIALALNESINEWGIYKP